MMRELDITAFFHAVDPAEYSASAAELGDNAGTITWEAALRDADHWALLPDGDAIEEFKAYVRGFGAWDREEIESWDARTTNALCIQFVAGDMREAFDRCEDWPPSESEWADYQARAERGTCTGRLYGSNAQVFYMIGD